MEIAVLKLVKIFFYFWRPKENSTNLSFKLNEYFSFFRLFSGSLTGLHTPQKVYKKGVRKENFRALLS